MRAYGSDERGFSLLSHIWLDDIGRSLNFVNFGLSNLKDQNKETYLAGFL